MDITDSDFFLPTWRSGNMTYSQALNREIRQLKNSENSEALCGNRIVHLEHKIIFYLCGTVEQYLFFHYVASNCS